MCYVYNVSTHVFTITGIYAKSVWYIVYYNSVGPRPFRFV